MNNRQLSWTRKYNNNHFIIASRAYFQQSPTCTRVNNLVHITMWLTLTGHITMWPTSKEFTRVNNLVHIAMWLTLNEFWFDHVMLVREVISQRVWTFQIRVCFTNIYVIFVDATTRYLEPFQIIALLYESGLLLRVIRISVKVRIDVTLYDELLFTSIIEKIP